MLRDMEIPNGSMPNSSNAEQAVGAQTAEMDLSSRQISANRVGIVDGASLIVASMTTQEVYEISISGGA